MAATTENPLLKALPPETDYLSYLTILEYNLTLEQLPVLHDILQDTSLTTNIGWDLVHLLLPLLPDSRLCLQDVARLGNPREVVLKATELLEKLGAPVEDVSEGEGDGEDEALTSNSPETSQGRDGMIEGGRNSALPATTENGGKSPAPDSGASKTPANTLEFTTLLSMLEVLHPRIKTKYPSRFLSTSLQAILPAYASVAANPEATEAVIKFIKALSETGRPKLPPRMSSTSVLAKPDTSNEPASAPDPEANDGSLGCDEAGLQKRLLQSFLTYVVEVFMTSLPVVEGVPGMVWSIRLHEKLHPKKNIPGRRTCIEMFTTSDLHNRDTIVGQLTALARDLKLTPEELLATVIRPEEDSTSPVEDLPSSASDVPLSRPGSLYLLAATAAASVLFDAPTSPPPLYIFPDFSSLLPTFIGVGNPSIAGSEPACLIDTILFLGGYLLSASSMGSAQDPEHLTETLQRVSLLSANTPVPSLRYHAHLLTAEILHAHDSEAERLSYIKDTLEHCPYENLKASAIGWLKTELLTANISIKDDDGREPSLFATPVAISTLAEHLWTLPLFPPSDHYTEEILSVFSNHQPLWMAILNLVYLILSSPSLLQHLDCEELSAGAVDFTSMLSSTIVPFIRKVATELHQTKEMERDLVLLEGMLEMVKAKLLEHGKIEGRHTEKLDS